MKKTSDNGYFIISPHKSVSLEKAHFCTWNLPGGLEFLEVGMLIQLSDSIISYLKLCGLEPRLEFKVFIPWYEGGYCFGDLFSTLKNPENVKFVFNDQVVETHLLSDGSSTTRGVHFSFREDQSFCLLPVVLDPDYEIKQAVSAKVVFPSDQAEFDKVGKRVYIRFFVKSKSQSIPWKRGGIAKTTFNYDIKVNEPRNAPGDFPLDQIVDIQSCYCLHIVPAAFECSLQDRVAFKSIRTLEATEATAYLNGVPEIAMTIKSGDCLVVFNKLKHEDNPKLPFSFFTVFARERIGPSQLALAIGANILCSMLSGWWKGIVLALFVLLLIVTGIRSGRIRH